MSETQLAAIQPTEILPMAPDDNFLAIAEKRLKAINEIKRIALGVTNPFDWVDQNGKPYLQASGAEKVARLFGVTIKDVKTRKETSEDDRGPFYFYVVEAVALARGGDSIVAVGTCSSRDQFFAKQGKEWKPSSEVDETNIMKAAYSNCLGNAITRFLGIRNMTWEEVETFTKFKRSDVASIQYKKRGQENPSPASSDLILSGPVNDTFSKPFKKADGTAGTRYLIKIGEREAATFSLTIFKSAMEFQNSKKEVQAVCSQNNYGLTIMSLTEKQSKEEQAVPATI